MDGVTEYTSDPSPPLGQNMQISDNQVSSCEQDSSNIIPIAKSSNAAVDGVTLDTASIEPPITPTIALQEPAVPTTQGRTNDSLDGVTPISPEVLLNKTANTETTERESLGLNQNRTLDGVTTDTDGSKAETASNSNRCPMKTINEILLNNDFPEKSLLIGWSNK